jgi:hypothetical protein
MNREKPAPGDLELIGTGPIDGAWRAPYLRCPSCEDLVEKSGYNACHCGAIAIDGDACRVIVRGVAESAIGQYALKG